MYQCGRVDCSESYGSTDVPVWSVDCSESYGSTNVPVWSCRLF